MLETLRYLYDNPLIICSQLMVALQKANSEYETDHNPYIEAKVKLTMAECVDGNKGEYDLEPELQKWFANKMQKKGWLNLVS